MLCSVTCAQQSPATGCLLDQSDVMKRGRCVFSHLTFFAFCFSAPSKQVGGLLHCWRASTQGYNPIPAPSSVRPGGPQSSHYSCKCSITTPNVVLLEQNNSAQISHIWQEDCKHVKGTHGNIPGWKSVIYKDGLCMSKHLHVHTCFLISKHTNALTQPSPTTHGFTQTPSFLYGFMTGKACNCSLHAYDISLLYNYCKSQVCVHTNACKARTHGDVGCTWFLDILQQLKQWRSFSLW